MLSEATVSIARGTFEWRRVLCLLRTNVVPYVIAYGGARGLLFHAAGYLGFPEAVVTPFVDVAGMAYQRSRDRWWRQYSATSGSWGYR